jgi:4-hydroxy-3-polyprenylbenzoate decarboxylase
LKLIIGISGASGVAYGIRLLEVLHQREGMETHLIITEMGKATIKMETDYSVQDVEKLATHVYGIKDLAASISSGSYKTDGMIVAPCLTRAADVTLKERRRLVLMFRETPLHAGHCELMLQATHAGAIVMPPVPAFYTRPKSLSDVVDQTVARVLDFWDLELGLAKRWV